MEVPEDIYYQIFLHSNIEELSNLCIASKHRPICNNNIFWIDKFSFDDIPILFPHDKFTFKDWIHLYKSYIMAEELVSYMLQHVNNNYMFEFNKHDDFVKLLPFEIKNNNVDDTLRVLLSKYKNNTINIILLYGTQNFIIDKNELINILAKIYFLYPHVKSLILLPNKYIF
jgi:hypothetical protein